jgi:hypothetical protein
VKAFGIYVPPQWEHLDLQVDPDGAIESFTRDLVRSAPLSRQPLVRQLVTESLAPRLRAFAAHGVATVLLPVGPVLVTPVRPLITFSPLPDETDVEPLTLVQGVASTDPTAELVEIRNLIALRTHSRVDVSPASIDAVDRGHETTRGGAIDQSFGADLVAKGERGELRLMSARVRYLLGDPDDAGRWVDIQFAADYPSTPEGVSLADEAIELFDALVPSFQWVS